MSAVLHGQIKAAPSNYTYSGSRDPASAAGDQGVMIACARSCAITILTSSCMQVLNLATFTSHMDVQSNEVLATFYQIQDVNSNE